MKKTERCTKCHIHIQEYTLCSKCYIKYTQNTKKNGKVDYQSFVSKNSTKEERDIYMIGPLWINAIKCLKCKDIVRSKNKHDMATCKCGASSVDGGSWYGKCSGPCVSKCEEFTDV